jgi:hypothetical protein
LKNCKGLLATLEREPDSSQKQVMKLSEQKRVSERMVLLAISGLLTFTRIKYDPNQTAAPNASKYMDKIALKHQKNMSRQLCCPQVVQVHPISSMSISKVHLRFTFQKAMAFQSDLRPKPEVPGPRTAQLILHLNQVSRPGLFRRFRPGSL